MGEHVPVLDYGASTYERDFWQGRGRDYEDRAERWALGRMLPSCGERLLDVGAGYGRLADLYGGHEQVLLLDYAPDLLRDARLRLVDRPPLALAASYYDIPLADGACDTVVMVRSLHHAADVPRVFSELRRVLRPGGILVLEHANKCHLKAMLGYWLGRTPTPFTLEPKEFAYLNFDFHPAYIRQHLARAGFVVEAERAVSTFRLPVLKRLVPPSLLAGLDGALQRPLARLHPSPSVFLRCRTAGELGQPQPGRPLFRCLRCRSTDLQEAGPGRLLCAHCGAEWPIVDGIYRFR